jgi:hypothetical protein
MIEPAHSPFGGSVATRVLRCPASVGLVEKVPAHLRRVSIYAERGTALHAAMALLIERERFPEDLVGETIEGYRITADDVENALRPALAYVETLLDEPGAEYYLEQRVVFPTIPGAFGTVDLIIRIGAAIYVVDLKFGLGVRVLALYHDGDEDVINAQLLFYAAAARHSFPDFFAAVDNITLMILQPQSIEVDAEMVSSVTVTHAELDAFIMLYRAACEAALTPVPRLQRGDWCRFCSARPICPAHTGIRTALHDQAKHALESGDHIPGYALSAGRAERHWHNENAAIGALIRLGFARGDVLAETMRSPKQIELRAKARGLKVAAELIASRRSGVALVRSENVRVPVPGRDELPRSFSAALEAFQRGEL